MKRNVFILALLFLCRLTAAAGPAVDRLTALHLECEQAYRRNDFIAMKETIDARMPVLSEMKDTDSHSYYSHLALLYKDLGSYHFCLSDIESQSSDKAVDNYGRSLDIYRNILKDSHGEAIVRTELAQLYYKTEDYDLALTNLTANRQHFMATGVERMELTTWAEMALCKARLGMFDEALKDIDSTICFSGRREVPVEHLRKKGKILALRAEGLGRPQTEAVPYFRQYFDFQRDSIRTAFSRMSSTERESYWLRMHPFITDCFRLEDSAAEMLYDVVLFSKSILLQFSVKRTEPVAPRWQDVQKRLGENDCAIEFIQYEKKGKMHIGALVLLPEGPPEFVRISDIESLSGFRINGMIPVSEAINKEISSYKDALYSCSNLNAIIWPKQLRTLLKGMKRVYFAADGIFHKMAVEYMYPEKNPPELRRLTSTRELLRDTSADLKGGMLICGGIDYMAKSEETGSTGNDRMAYELLCRQHAYFRNLKGAMKEAEDIYRLRACPDDTLLTGSAAGEQMLEEAMQKYQMVAIATHGYFGGSGTGKGTDLKTWDSDGKLSQSVLIMSGAQRNINDPDFNPERQDGIISARELSGMDLSNIRLFIMSACQSGLGEITADGVFGLQRGLKNAGVEAMIVSLWEVNDQATAYFMTNFHKALAEGKKIGEAFDMARASMDDEIIMTDAGIDTATLSEGEAHTIKSRKYSKPQHKNAFILIDNL